MIYRLLNSGTCVLLTRQPKIFEGNATFMFKDVPEGAVAVFTIENATYYREITAGKCSIPVEHLDGDISVAVRFERRGSRSKVYKCEGLKASRVMKRVLLAPNDSNLSEEFAKMKIEHDDMKTEIERLRREFDNLQKKFTTMMEGYGLV